MATHIYEQFTPGTPLLLPNYLTSLDSRFTKNSETEISVNNGDAIITVANNGMTITVNGTVVFNKTTTFNGLYVDVVLGESLIYFKITRPNGDYNGHFAWITDGNGNNYVGTYYGYGVNYNYLEISDLDFIKVSTNANGYKIVKMINFAAPAGEIAFSTIAPLANNGQLALYAADILSCSTMARGASIALPNGKNYYTIGANAMIEITS